MAGDVLEDDPPEAVTEFSGDTGDVWPEVPGVVGPEALSCGRPRLAWISGEEGVDCPGEGAGVECGEVVPDRGRGEVSGALRCDEDRSRVFLDFNPAEGSESRLRKPDSHVETASSTTKAKAVLWSGRYTHAMINYLPDTH
nr:hypothetical protein [Pseudooceanicola atlanticus]